MKNISSILLAGAVAVASAQAQNIIPPARLGGYLGANVNLNNPSALVWGQGAGASLRPVYVPLAAGNDSTRFTTSSTELGFAIGVMGAVPLSKTIHLGGRIGFNGMGGTSSATQRNADTVASYELSSSTSTLELAPVVEFYDLIPNLSLHPLVGLELGIPLGQSITQTAQVSATAFGNNQRETIVDGASIPNTTLRAALLVGIGYTAKLSDRWYIQPELTYRLPLTNVSSAQAYSPWTVSQIRLSVNVFFGFGSDDSSPTTSSTSRISASMDRIVSLDDVGREQPVSQIAVEDMRYNEMFPLIPYAFYGENSATPDPALQNRTVDPTRGEFSSDALPLDAIEINRNLLNVLGSRLRSTPQATLTITGTHDGKGEAKTANLALQRAESVKTYLQSAFGIDASRLKVEQRGVPARPSSSTDADGVAENRRVEFSSNVPDILSPIILTAENQRIADPELIVFYPNVVTEDSVRSWTLRIAQAGSTLRDINGKGRPGSLSWTIKPNELSNAQVPVDWEFTVASTAGDTALATGSIPVEYLSSVRKRTEDLPDKSIDKYSLVLFDFDKSELTPDNRRVLEQMVLPSIKTNSKVTVIGYTDRIGGEDYNKKLSKERAEAVKAFLAARAKDAKYSAAGVGEQNTLFTQEQPIGRQLSRTVQVVVETPRR